MKKEKIILINPINPDPAPNYFGPPYGLSLIGASLLQDDRKVLAYDYAHESYAVMIFSIKQLLKREKPKYIGITLQSSNRGAVYDLIKTIKEFDESIEIILGGVFATSLYELILHHFPVDVIVLGEGEETIIELLNALDAQRDLKAVKGIAYKKKGHIFVTENREKNTHLDNLAYPAFHLFKDFENKINHEGNGITLPDFILKKRCTVLKNALMLISSRGCVYSCNFCSMSKASPPKIRFHSPRYFVNMLEYFHRKYNIKNFIFGDNFFTYKRQRVIDICEEIERRKIKIKWNCMTRPDYVDSELLKKMFDAGCFEISFGVESGSKKMQKRIGKNLDLIKTKRTFHLANRIGIRAVLMLMVGNTGETTHTIKETLSFIKDLNPDQILVKTLQVYPDTEVHDFFEKQGLMLKNYYLTHQHQAPFFTAEHPLSRLESFNKMIQTRTTFIQLGHECNNHCLFCVSHKHKADGGQKLSDLLNAIKLASTRGDRIYLFGGEPFLNKNFQKILNSMCKLDVHHVHIQTNARIFSIPKKLMLISGHEMITKMSIPIFGLNKIHNFLTQVPCAYAQTVEGIRNLKKYHPRIALEAQIIIHKTNMDELDELVEAFLNLGIDAFKFVFSQNASGSIKTCVDEIPTFSQTSAALGPIISKLNKKGKEFVLEGFPLCVLKAHEVKSYEFSHIFDELIYADFSLHQGRELRKNEKVKPDICKKCGNNPFCEGVWESYIFLYGRSILKPAQHRKPKLSYE